MDEKSEMNTESGAVDVFACLTRTRTTCRCEPPCKWCGYRKHMAIHGAFLGKEVGSKPVGHEFAPTEGDKEP